MIAVTDVMILLRIELSDMCICDSPTMRPLAFIGSEVFASDSQRGEACCLAHRLRDGGVWQVYQYSGSGCRVCATIGNSYTHHSHLVRVGGRNHEAD